jgi:nucleoid-associated protein YgaU
MVGFALVLVVGILVADHFSKASLAQVNAEIGSGSVRDLGQFAAIEPALPSPIPAGPIDPLLSSPAPGAAADQLAAASEERPSSVFTMVMGGTRPELASDQPQDTLSSAGAAIRNGISQLGLDSPEPALMLDSPQRVPDRSDIFASEIAAVPPPAPPAEEPLKSEARVSRGKLLRHEVASGDNLSKLAGKYYNDKNLWRRLQAYNASSVGADGTIRTGTTLLIPPKEVLLGEARLAADAQAVAPRSPQPEPTRTGAPAKAAPTKSAPAKPAPRMYTVKRGDTLLTIAQRQLGTTKRWKEIRDLNRKRIDNLDNIHVGLVLALPSE